MTDRWRSVVNQADLPLSNIAATHPYAEIFIVQEGEVTMTDGESERVIRAGDVAVVGPGEPHAFTNTGDGPLRQIDIHLSSHFKTEWL